MKYLPVIILSILLIASVNAQELSVLATSQMGYHPESNKQAVYYTDASSGTFTVMKGSTAVLNGDLHRPRNMQGDPVNCQGGLPCLVADFSQITETGTYTLRASAGGNSETTYAFDIRSSIYADNNVFLDYFEAQKQQGSDYHADMHRSTEPRLLALADGSFIMVADQAALTLARMGSAYRRNPQFFGSALADHMLTYAQYLMSLQGANVVEDPNGFRTNWNVEPISAFVPGPTDRSELKVYHNDNDFSTVPVYSLCGEDDNSTAWQECIDYAEEYYKCQIDEPCLNMTYQESRGSVVYDNTMDVARGWRYDWSCDVDIDLDQGMFNEKHDPCLFFDDSKDPSFTVMTLHGLAQSYPALLDYDRQPEEILSNIEEMQQYIENNVDLGREEKAFYGAALFLLYDYTGNNDYLLQAYGLRTDISRSFVADGTHGNEFYWEEYIRHKDAIENNQKTYLLPADTDMQDPAELFRGKVYKEYKDEFLAMSKNGERVFEKYRGYGFQNSRHMLTMGLLAGKTMEYYGTPEPFIKEVADNQIAWLTGMNGVEEGVSQQADITSYSFIVGIGEKDPDQFHSRYLVDTGLSQATKGSLIGTRGTSKRFENNGTLDYLDGVTNIMGYTLGAKGNGLNGETKIEDVFVSKSYKGEPFVIPGWINGAYDVLNYGDNDDDDVIFNYDDDANTYEFTESTNEIVATALEYFAYLDAHYNEKEPHALVARSNSTSPDETGSLTILTNPSGSTITLDGEELGVSQEGEFIAQDIEVGTHTVKVNHTGYTTNTTTIDVKEGNNLLEIVLEQNSQEGILHIFTTPGTNIRVNNTLMGITDEEGYKLVNHAQGTYPITLSKNGYKTYKETITIEKNSTLRHNLTISDQNYSLLIVTDPAGVSVALNGQDYGETNQSGQMHIVLSEDIYDVSLNKTGFVDHHDTITLSKNMERTYELDAIPTSFNILSNTSTLKSINGTGWMYETDNTTFTVVTNNPTEVTWYIDGKEWKTTPQDTEHTVIWIPGPLYVEGTDVEKTTLSAKVPGDTVTWRFDTLYVINTYPEGTTGAETFKIWAYTNRNVYDFTRMSAFIDTGAVLHYSLGLKWNSSDKAEWVNMNVPAKEGNNYLVKITGYVNDTNTTHSFDLGRSMWHYREPENDGGKRRRSSGGGTLSLGNPELVYVVMEEDTIHVNDTQTLTLDAKNFNGGVLKVEATLNNPASENISINFTRVNGSKEYGTWKATLDGLSEGLYTLEEVRLWGQRSTPTVVKVEDRQFYAISGQASDEEMGLVYYVLDKNTLRSAGNVSVVVDARDSLGIETMVATISSKHGEKNITLARQDGTAQYGSWRGIFQAAEPDTTYTLKSITMTNSNATKTHELGDRSVYVYAERDEAQENRITGAVVSEPQVFSEEWFNSKITDPLLPTVIAFTIMTLIVVGALLRSKAVQ